LFLTAKSFEEKIEIKGHYFAFLDKMKRPENGRYTGPVAYRKQYISNLTLITAPRIQPGIKKRKFIHKTLSMLLDHL
jgi:hypothetical protein